MIKGDFIDLYRQQRDRYKQALEEIETYCTDQLNEHFNHCEYAKGCVNACGISKETLLGSILEIINEVKDADRQNT